MGRTSSGLAAAAVGCALAAAPDAARAQLTSESFLRNHDTRSSFSTSYTPGSGSDRVVVAIVTSEYVLASNSQVAAISLGGVPMRFLGTEENERNKKNRLSLYYLPETEIPAGTATFSISYTEPASSMIYLATALGIRRDVPPSTPVFEENCYRSRWVDSRQQGRIAFAPITAEPSDLVLSWVATGDQDSRTTFANGGTEFLDERRQSPGFSLSGALQSPQTPATISGDAFVSDGCQKRPLTMQFLLRPKGNDGAIGTPPSAAMGQPVTVTITDPDLDLRDTAVDTVDVTIRNLRTGQSLVVTAIETGPNTGVFTVDVATAEGSGDTMTIGAQTGDTLRAIYEDALTRDGPPATRTSETILLAGARLVAAKSVAPVDAAAFMVPGSDVLYTIEVANDGFGTVDRDTIFIVDALPDLDFVVGDPVVGDANTDPVLFTQTGAGLAFDYASDVGFAPPGAPPASLIDCPLRPAPGPVSGLGFLCVRPRGEMAAGDPDPTFRITFRMRVR